MKKKDYIILAGIILIGAMIYVVLGTDLFFSDEQPAPTASTSSFRNFNTEVEKRKADDFSSKQDAYEAELKEQRDAENIADMQRRERLKLGNAGQVDDLSNMMGKAQRAEEKPSAVSSTSPTREPTVQSTAKPTTKATTGGTAKQTTQKPTPVATEKKRKRGDPVFGEEAPPQVSAQPTANVSVLEGQGVIHEEKKVQQNSTLKIRVTEGFKISACEVKTNSILTGYCRYDQQSMRMLVTITSIFCDGKTTPVNLGVYDGYDNQLGLALKETSDEQEVGKEVAGGLAEDLSDRMGLKVIKRATSSSANKKLNSASLNIALGHKVVLKEHIR